eukprot:m.151559 g.151559  ORF g.151559 m.151559 type:complete len:78 (+) comp20701_c0_seq2:188-421(+)
MERKKIFVKFFDTKSLRFVSGRQQKGIPFRSFVEVDYAEVVQRKSEYIQSKHVLHDLWKPNQDRTTCWPKTSENLLS